jgi:hypothetical protein
LPPCPRIKCKFLRSFHFKLLRKLFFHLHKLIFISAHHRHKQWWRTWHPPFAQQTQQSLHNAPHKFYVFQECIQLLVPHFYWKQLENKQEMKHSRFMKWNNYIN